MQRTITVIAQIMSKGKDTEWEIANTESSPRLFSRSTNHLRYFETNYHITRHLFDFLFGPYFQNFKSMKGEQSGHSREEARREARHANRPYYRDPSSPGRGPPGCGTPPSGPRRAGSRRVSSPTRPLSEYLFLN